MDCVGALALEKLAKYAAQDHSYSDIQRLCNALPAAVEGHMSRQQFEVLIALSKCTSQIASQDQAQKLVDKLGTYFVHMPAQSFVTYQRPFQRSNPWLSATRLLAMGLIDLGSMPTITSQAEALLLAYLDRIEELIAVSAPVASDNDDDNATAATVTVSGLGMNQPYHHQHQNTANIKSAYKILSSFQGFLEALAARADKFPAGYTSVLVDRIITLINHSFAYNMQLQYSTVAFFKSVASFFIEQSAYRPEDDSQTNGLANGAANSGDDDRSSYNPKNRGGTSTTDRSAPGDEKYSLIRFLIAQPKVTSDVTNEQKETLSQIVQFALSAWDGLAIDDADLDLYMSVRSTVLEILAAAVQLSVFDPEKALNILSSGLMLKMDCNHSFYQCLYNFGAYLSRHNEAVGLMLCRSLPDFVAHPAVSVPTVENISQIIAADISSLSQDNYVTLIYTLVNMLTDNEPVSSMRRNRTYGFDLSELAKTSMMNGSLTNLASTTPRTPSINNLSTNVEIRTTRVVSDTNVNEYLQRTCRNVVTAISKVAASYGDPQIATLSSTVLSQKLGKVNRVADFSVIHGLSLIAPHVSEKEFRVIFRTYLSLELNALKHNDEELLKEISDARCIIAKSLSRTDPLYTVYLGDLLTTIVSKGDLQNVEHHYRSHTEVSATAKEIAMLLPPLSSLLPKLDEPPFESADWHMTSLFRNAWFNMVVHGFSRSSEWTSKYESDLKILARSTPPLVSETSANMVESELELNTVLRRGSSHHNVNDQKAVMTGVMSIKSNISYPKLMFLSAAVLLETLRATTGDCHKVLLYFGDPDFRSGDTFKYMSNIALEVTRVYLNQVTKSEKAHFTIERATEQLKQVLILCCHRVSTIQSVAFSCAELIINEVPSALCRAPSLFALLDLMTLLWTSCLDAETDEYEPRTVFTSANSDISLELSDSYDHRHDSLTKFVRFARQWVGQVLLPLMSFEVKSLLTQYLAQSGQHYKSFQDVALGCTFALEMGGHVTRSDGEIATVAQIDSTLGSDTVSGFLSQFLWRSRPSTPDNEISIEQVQLLLESVLGETGVNASSGNLNGHSTGAANGTVNVDVSYDSIPVAAAATPNGHFHAPPMTRNPIAPSYKQVSRALIRAAGHLCRTRDQYFVHLIVAVPFKLFTVSSMQMGISLWLNVMSDAPQLRPVVIAQVCMQWARTVNRRRGMYSRKYDEQDPQYLSMEYAPSNKADVDHMTKTTLRLFEPHSVLIRFMSSVLQASAFGSKHTLRLFVRLCTVALLGLRHASQHPMARQVRLELTKFSIDVCELLARTSPRSADRLRVLIVSSILTWFSHSPAWPFGGNKLRLRSSIELLREIRKWVSKQQASAADYSINEKVSSSQSGGGAFSTKKELAVTFLADEIAKLSTWLEPLTKSGPSSSEHHHGHIHATPNLVQAAWSCDPALAVYLVDRSREPSGIATLESLIAENPLAVAHIPAAIRYYLVRRASSNRHLLYFAPTSPVEAINLFLPSRHPDSFILQYAMRSLESHDVRSTFFYVPQIVQSLRYDSAGYIERYILETAKLSQLFAHQIIWNIKANSYKDEDSNEPDPMKPTLDRVVARMIDEFSPESKSFYEREFSFFNEVTSISGKLKAYIKKSKAEKKAKIDEEIAKISVDVGVYLPSNPDGVVIAIDRKSGKPLQSHAKAPFLAKFKIRKPVAGTHDSLNSGNSANVVGGDTGSADIVADNDGDTVANGKFDGPHYEDVWQGAIFKVGDDCRQDLLALQIISVFRTIFMHSGLDLYVYPYRVTATAPGCGVIDVLPNSISRDMLGREAVNGLYEYFTSKHGGEDSIDFQRARNNFVKSLAAYSVISYLIQFKDRHNGNIMYDNDGHILHIDFGFCFDIVPGGVKFEAAPFKLTSEMVAVMGGSTRTQAYRWFEELSVKAFLASRPYAEIIVQMVMPMLDSGLPCFKGETTIKKLRNRFVLDKSDRDAAIFFRSLIKKSVESIYTKGYDEFQRITNGIPY